MHSVEGFYFCWLGVSNGYSMVWDNVGKMLKARHQSTTRQNKMMLWALSYAAENRVKTTNLTLNTVVPATSIHISNLFPSEGELGSIRMRMKTIVGRIITANIPFLKDNFKGCVPKHLRHKYWREASKKSNVVLHSHLDSKCYKVFAIHI